MPNGLELELKPTSVNHDEDFLNNWYKKLQYSLAFVKDVVTFCNTIITNLTTEIQKTENELKNLKKTLTKKFKIQLTRTKPHVIVK